MSTSSEDKHFQGLRHRHLPGNGPTLLLLHSLSANAHVFDGLLKAGLGADFNLIIPDLPGRGDSAKTSIEYSIEAQAAAMLRLFDHHGVEKATVAGHSFGGFLGMYLAAHHPERVARLVLLDSAPMLNPFTPAMVAVLLDRLMQVYPSFDAYLLKVKMSPYLTFWEADTMLPYHRADVDELPGGVVVPKPKIPTISALVAHLPMHNWRVIAARIRQSVLLIAAREPFIAGHPILTEDLVNISAGMIPDAEAAWVEGNHQTMLYGAGARQIVGLIRAVHGYTEPALAAEMLAA